jgi:thymidylate synthase (FAD)
MFTSYYVTGSLAAWARMYKQRMHDTAQKEIRTLAENVADIIEPLYPVSWAALTEE